MDQATNLSEVLAWSLTLKSVLRTANIYDVSSDTSDNKRDIIKDTSEELMMLVLCGINCSIVVV